MGHTDPPAPPVGPDPEFEQDRLGRNARHLSISAAVTAVLGLAYWMAAERLFETAEVGRATVAVSTATMLGTLSCLSLGGMYERFLTSSGHRVRRLFAAGCTLVLGTGLLVGGGFTLAGEHGLFTTTAERWLFPVVVAVFALFALTDPILVGLRDARVVAVKNIAHSVAKLAALPFAALAASSAGVIYGSWAALSAVAAALGLLWAWRRSTLPVLDRPTELPRARSLVTHHAAVFSMMLVSLILPLYLPLVVLRMTDSTHAAWFGLAQVLVSGSTLFLAAVQSSYVAEASHPGTDTVTITRRVARISALLALACAAVLAFAGPFILGLVGPDYREHATGHLVFMALAILPQAVVGTYVAMARIRNRMVVALVAQIGAVAAVVLLAPWGVDRWGLTGVGAVFFGVEMVSCLVVLIPLAGSWRALTRRAG